MPTPTRQRWSEQIHHKDTKNTKGTKNTLHLITAITSLMNRAIFEPLPDAPTRAGRTLSLLWMAALYGFGVAHWVIFFFSAPKSLAPYALRFDAYQWPREFVFLSVLQRALREGVVPYHVSPALKETTRFLGIPDFVLSPQILLLRVVELPTFLLLNTLLLFTLCFVGCLLIRRRYRLSLYAFTVLLLFFAFNGNLTAQLGAGQYVWVGFLLFPFVAYLVLRLVEGGGRALVPALAFTLALLSLQGTYHFYVWGVMLLALVALFNAPLRRRVAAIAGLSVLGTAVRLLPPALTFWGERRPFISGYPTLETLAAALVTIRPHDAPTEGVLANLAWWEYDLYVGLLGAGVLAYFGLWLAWKERPELAAVRFRALDWPLLVMALASLSLFFAPITSLPLPLLGAERVSSRFLILPLLLLATMAVLRLNLILPTLVRGTMARVVALAALAMGAMSLFQHSMAWRPSVLESEAPLGLDLPRIAAAYEIVDIADPLYIALVNGSALLSLLSLIALAVATLVLWRHDSSL